MVTRAYIDGLRSSGRFFPQVNRSEIVQVLLTGLQDGLPDWDDPPTDALLYRALPYMAEAVQSYMETNHSQLLRALLIWAEGSDLDVIGVGPPAVLRRLNEPDDDYRLRIAQSHLLFSRGTIEGVEALASEFNADIEDVRAYVSPNRQDVKVFPIKADVTQLTAQESTDLQTYLSSDSNEIAGVVTTVAEPTIKEYRITATGTYDATLNNEDTVVSQMRTALYAFITDNTRVGWDLYKSALEDAGFVPELRDVSVSFVRPTSGNTFTDGDSGNPVTGNLVAQKSFTAADIYTCVQDTDNVIITVNEL